MIEEIKILILEKLKDKLEKTEDLSIKDLSSASIMINNIDNSQKMMFEALVSKMNELKTSEVKNDE